MKAITANRLTDGHVIYRTADAAWSTDYNAAHALSEAEAETALAVAERDVSIVVGPYLIELGETAPAGQNWRREGIRIDGPTSGTTRPTAPAHTRRAA